MSLTAVHYAKLYHPTLNVASVAPPQKFPEPLGTAVKRYLLFKLETTILVLETGRQTDRKP